MFLVLFLAITACITVWLVLRWSKVKRYWAERGVPHLPPHPILGSLTFLQRENTGAWMRQMYNKFRSPYIGMWMLWRPALIINCPDIARRVLIKDSDNFRNRFLSSGKSDPVGGLNLFTVNDPIWTNVRRRLTAVFTGAKLRALQQLNITKSTHLVERINKEMAKCKFMNLRVVCTDYTTDIIGESAFGLKSEAALTGDSIMRQVTKELTTFTVFRGLSWSSIFFCPELVDVFGFTLFPKNTVKYLRQLLNTIVQQRGGYEKKINETNDLLDALLKMKQDAAADGEEMDEDLILAQAAVFVLAGFDTSGAGLSWVVYEMAFRPDLQERLYQELLHAKENIGNRDFDSNTLAELPYLNAVIKETLRKFPPMGWLDRVAAKEYKINDQLTISAGTAVFVNAIGMHWDPDLYPEPEKFDPDRFMPENEHNIKPYTFMPFGEGPRICIGMRFAYQSLRYAVSSLFLNFEVTAAPNVPKPNDCNIEKKGMFYMPDEQLLVNFKPRNYIFTKT